MKITISDTVPAPYSTQKGTTYETRYLYTGFGRYNEHEKTLEVTQVNSDGTYTFFSRPHQPEVFSRVYHVEPVLLTLYSASPRVWKEEVGGVVFFFQEIVQDGAQPSF
jgi:hypothetical protein